MAIAIPADMKKGKVSWTIGQTTRSLTVALEGVSGVVTFTPTAVAIPYQTMTVLPGPQEAKVVAGVMQTIELTANDPEVWAWQVAPRLGPQDDIVPWPSWHINVPAGGTVDLATASVTPGVGPVKVIEGPQGPSAYDVAVANGYQGTQAQWLASLKGDGSAWSDVTGKPDVFPPAGHSHVVGDVTGLAARLAALEYDSGWRDVSTLLPEGLAKSAINGRCNLRRMNGRLLVDMNLTISKAGLTSVMTFPSGFRADIPALAPYTYWTSTTANDRFPSTLATSYVGGGGTTLRVTDTPAVGTLMIYLDFPIRGAIPTPPPGTPI